MRPTTAEMKMMGHMGAKFRERKLPPPRKLGTSPSKLREEKNRRFGSLGYRVRAAVSMMSTGTR